MTSLDEQETTVTQLRNQETLIYTANPVHLRRLRKESRAREVRGGDEWGEFIIANSDFDPLKGFKRKSTPMSDERKAELALRLETARNAKNGT